jgi:hypothetical protein
MNDDARKDKSKQEDEEMNSYLWDATGEPEREVERLEKILLPLRYEPQRLVFAPQAGAHAQRRKWILWMTPVFAAVTSILLCVAFSHWRLQWRADSPWPVRVLAGQPLIGGAPLVRESQLGVGQVLLTNSVSSAEVRVARIGILRVAPNTELELVATRAHGHRIALKRGKISARIWAPPWSLSMETPSAMAFDLGCAFTLEVAPDGSGSVKVSSGWVQLESESSRFQSLVPAGAQASTRIGFPPGSPYFDDAAPEFQLALQNLNFGNLDPVAYQAALRILLAHARTRDALTLFNLLARSDPEQRGLIFDRAAQLVPPPAGITRDGVISGNILMLDEWWRSLGYRSAKTWWVNWKDGLFF